MTLPVARGNLRATRGPCWQTCRFEFKPRISTAHRDRLETRATQRRRPQTPEERIQGTRGEERRSWLA